MEKRKMKKVLVLVLIAVSVTGLGLAMRACRAQEAPAPQPPEAAQAQDGQEPGQEGTGGTGTGPGALDARQQALAESYTDTEKEAAALLSANVWAAGGSSATLRFGEHSFTESRNGAPDAVKPFVIAASRVANSPVDASGGYTTTYTLAADTGGKEHIFTLTQAHTASGEAQPWSVECGAFAYSPAYTRIDQAIDLSLEGVGEELTALLGGDGNVGRMHALIKGYCSQHYPSATAAAWDGKAAIDYAQGTAVFAFALNNSAKTNIKVLHVLGSDAFEIGR